MLNRVSLVSGAALLALATGRAAADSICEARAVDCRAKLVAYINAETMGLDVGTEDGEPRGAGADHHRADALSQP